MGRSKDREREKKEREREMLSLLIHSLKYLQWLGDVEAGIQEPDPGLPHARQEPS